MEDYFKQMKRKLNEGSKPATLQPVKTAAKALGSGEKIKIKLNVKKKTKGRPTTIVTPIAAAPHFH